MFTICWFKKLIKVFIYKIFKSYNQIKTLHKNSLFFININTLKISIVIEQRFRYYKKYFDDINNIKLFLIKNFNIKIKCDIFECHNLLTKIIVRFVIFSLRIYNKRKSISLPRRYDSKSIMCIIFVKNTKIF